MCRWTHHLRRYRGVGAPLYCRYFCFYGYIITLEQLFVNGFWAKIYKITKYGPIAQLGERTVRIRKVVGSIPIRSTTKSREIINFTAFFQLFCKNGGPVAQPFPCLFEKMLPNNSQALSTFPFRTSLMACSHIIEKPKNKRSSQKRLIRIQAECT